MTNAPSALTAVLVTSLHAIFAPHGVAVPVATLIQLSAPKGPQWEFLVVFAVLLLGPVIFKRAGIPGIIGLLVGGYAIGPHGLDAIGPGNNTLPDLGQLGLLYLMFVAGVELDLNLLRKHRRSTVMFGLLTFALPLTLGALVGFALGWSAQAAILLGSLLASHTLITYPTVREAGLSSDPAVATAVGSTVLTDTLTLTVLAAVAGTVGGSRSGLQIAAQIVVGLIALIAFSMLVLPLLATWAFRLLGAERPVRYIVAITAFLSAATVAELFGIEGIVGAFFAGLALNRLVPNEGQLMERIEFFGGAVFIPVFLVSVGLILDPAVMFQAETLELAGLFVLACLGGKVLAAWLAGRALGFSGAQATLLFSLSSAQAAATLAATVIGFQLGLFDSAVVNAVLVLIFVSVLVSTITGMRASRQVQAPDRGSRPLGARVVVGVGDPDRARGALAIAVRIARADGGVVHPVLVLDESAPYAPRAAGERLARVVAETGVDGVASTIVDRSVLHGARRAGAAQEATLVLVSERPRSEQPDSPGSELLPGTADAGAKPPPVAIVHGDAERLGSVRTLLADDDASAELTAEMARRVAGGAAAEQLDQSDADWAQTLAATDVTFVCTDLGEAAAELGENGRGVVVATLTDQDLAPMPD